MIVEIFSDFVCPWCYMGHRRIAQALRELPDSDRPDIHWRSYQLAPDDDTQPGASAEEAMSGWYAGVEVAKERIGLIRRSGQELGLSLDLEKARPVNTFDAHRLSHLAAEYQLSHDLHERIYAAYFSEGLNIADPAVLHVLGTAAGLESCVVSEMLSSGRFASTVMHDRNRARERNIRGVPRLVVDGHPPVSPNHSDLASLLARLR